MADRCGCFWNATLTSVGDDGIVMRPDRSPMIVKRIEDALYLRQGAPSPSAEHVVAHQPVGNDAAIFVDDSCELCGIAGMTHEMS
jgi:hypothetical protein